MPLVRCRGRGRPNHGGLTDDEERSTGGAEGCRSGRATVERGAGPQRARGRAGTDAGGGAAARAADGAVGTPRLRPGLTMSWRDAAVLVAGMVGPLLFCVLVHGAGR